MNSELARRYLPTEIAYHGPRLSLTRLVTDKDAETRELFIALATRVIGAAYDEIDDRFGSNIADIDSHGYDQFGYFTIGKEVWVAHSAETSGLVGFEVITRKRGGSIKLGPTLLLQAYQGHGFAGEMIEMLLETYSAAGARKVYVTAPLDHIPTAALDLRSLGMHVEAILRHQYRGEGDERVFGRFLRPDSSEKISARVVTDSDRSEAIRVIPGLHELPRSTFSSLVVGGMTPAYDDIDESFVRAVLAAHDRGVESPYEEKGKLIYTIWADKTCAGAVVCTPKRGGAVKVAPLLIESGYASEKVVRAVLHRVGEDMRAQGRRKLFFLIPTIDWNVIRMLYEHGLLLEGILRAPYKTACDVIILTQFLR